VGQCVRYNEVIDQSLLTSTKEEVKLCRKSEYGLLMSFGFL